MSNHTIARGELDGGTFSSSSLVGAKDSKSRNEVTELRTVMGVCPCRPGIWDAIYSPAPGNTTLPMMELPPLR